jgi:CRISPR/Cas system CMR subunit Cmr6 (Cas7 group RAMP superfamily)
MREAVHTFDTHEYIKSFKQTGMKEVQAEAIVRAIKESRDFDFSRLATKDQLKNLEQKLIAETKIIEQKIETTQQSLEQKIENVEQNLEQKIENVEQKIETSEERLRGEIKASETTVIKWMFAGIIPLAGLLVHIAMKLPS